MPGDAQTGRTRSWRRLQSCDTDMTQPRKQTRKLSVVNSNPSSPGPSSISPQAIQLPIPSVSWARSQTPTGASKMVCLLPVLALHTKSTQCNTARILFLKNGVTKLPCLKPSEAPPWSQDKVKAPGRGSSCLLLQPQCIPPQMSASPHA